MLNECLECPSTKTLLESLLNEDLPDEVFEAMGVHR